jgi:hypothetical protein
MITKPLSQSRSKEPNPPSRWFLFLGMFLVFFPVLLYFYSFSIYTTNVPFSDDFSTLNEVMQILKSETLLGKFALLFTHQNEHLHVLTRSVFMLVYFFFGSIDFKILVLIGNVALLGLLFFAYKTLPEKQEKIFILTPVALLLFQLKQNWVHLIWAMEALAALYALFFAGLSFYFLGKNSTKYFWWALFVALISVLTHGSGAAIPLVGGSLLLIQKRFSMASIWVVGVLPIMVIYFSKLHFVADNPITVLSLNDLARIGRFFISFIGAMASYDNQTSLFTLGAFIIFYFIFLVFKKYYKTNIAVFGFMVYLFFVAAMVALSRSGVDEGLVFSNRYKIFSLTIVMLVYISAVDLFYPSTSRRWFFLAGMILVMGCMFLVSYGGGREKLEFARHSQLYRINQWLDKNYSLYDKSESRTNMVMTKALTGGFYKVPYQFTRIPDGKYSTSVNSSVLCNKESQRPIENAFNIIVVGSDISPIAVRIEGMIYGSKTEPPVEPEPVYVVLRSRAGSYIFTSHSHKRTYSSIHFQKDKSNIGLISLIPINKLQNNSYQIGLCYQGRVVYSNRLIIKREHLVKVVN